LFSILKLNDALLLPLHQYFQLRQPSLHVVDRAPLVARTNLPL
jgi:hypothetical protein